MFLISSVILSQRRRMMILAFWIATSLMLLAMTPAQANVLDWRLWDADGKLKAEKFSEAKDQYLKIQVHEPENPRLNYNLGIANYREGDMIQAMNSFQLATVQTNNSKLREQAFYNLGNSHFKMQDYQSAISSYEAALEIDPNDEDAKHNLELAKKKLEEQKQNQDQNQDKKDQDKNKDNKDGDKGNDDKDSGDKDDQKKDKENDDQKKDQKQNQDQKPQNQNKRKQDQTKEGGLSQKDVERMLMQVQEADPSEVQQNKANMRGQAPSKNLNPW